jgi:hypothetical protein
MTIDRRFVKPREGFKVRDPYTKLVIPAEGAWVGTTGGYGTTVQKHINARDLIECDPPVAEDLFVHEELAAPLVDELPRNALRSRTRREAAVDQRQAEGVSSDAREPSEKGEL